MFPEPGLQDLAFLQYTSGSTSDPKGVMVSHGNLLANCEMIRLVYGNTRATTYVSWVPLYHDMGLILNVLQTLYVGSLCVLMAPVSFMQRPLNWLRAISDYRAEFATAPNFAFDLCVDRFRPDQMAGIDLSGWKIALNGAEPVRAETMERFIETFAPYGFDPKACSPAYGLAEATLLASGGGRGRGLVRRRVSREALQRYRAAAPSSEADAQIRRGLRQGARRRKSRDRRSRKRADGFKRVMSARSGFPVRMSPRAIGKTPRPPLRPSGRASKGKPRSAGFAPAISGFSMTRANSSSPGASRT